MERKELLDANPDGVETERREGEEVEDVALDMVRMEILVAVMALFQEDLGNDGMKEFMKLVEVAIFLAAKRDYGNSLRVMTEDFGVSLGKLQRIANNLKSFLPNYFKKSEDIVVILLSLFSQPKDSLVRMLSAHQKISYAEATAIVDNMILANVLLDLPEGVILNYYDGFATDGVSMEAKGLIKKLITARKVAENSVALFKAICLSEINETALLGQEFAFSMESLPSLLPRLEEVRKQLARVANKPVSLNVTVGDGGFARVSFF